MAKNAARRQRIRKGLIIILFLTFPVTINYFSPYLIIDGASQGIINGSFIVFALQFAAALFLGRAWCGWVCPAGGLQEACFLAQDKKAAGGKWDLIKWAIWGIWIAVIAAAAISAGGYQKVDMLHKTENVVSLTDPYNYVIYYIVLASIVILSLAAGKRGFCHYMCWMAPFMIIGRKIRNLFKWPALRLKAQSDQCTNCNTCTDNCPMSLDVNSMVQRNNMENTECILCGSCVDNCPHKVISYTL